MRASVSWYSAGETEGQGRFTGTAEAYLYALPATIAFCRFFDEASNLSSCSMHAPTLRMMSFLTVRALSPSRCLVAC